MISGPKGPVRQALLPLVCALVACGNGVPVEAAATPRAATCATNDDCVGGTICVHSACVAFGGEDETDAGQQPADLYCQACLTDADCGAEGNYCLAARSGSARYCGTACFSDADCQSGARCFVFSGRTERNCYPDVANCGAVVDTDGGVVTVPDAGHVVDAGVPDAGAMACTTDTWSNFAQNLLVTQCIACHDHTHRFNNSYSSVNSNRTTIRRDISNGSMPRSPQAITASEKTRIIKWIDCGLPQ